MSDRPYISILDAAKLLGLGVSSVRGLFDAGEIAGMKTPGGHRRLLRKDVQRLYAELHQQQSAGRILTDFEEE